MERVYQRIRWENEPSTATPIDEDNLNKTDYAIYEIDGRVIEHQRLIEGLQQYETRAAEAAAEAELSASEALSSQQAAAISESNAKTSETNARSSETNAKTSETNARTSEVNTKESEDNTKLSEANAAASEVAAKSSEDNAKESEEKAENAATRASNSAIESQQSSTQANQYMNASKSSSEDSEAWAVGKRGGIPVQSEDETYRNNSKYYAEMASAVSGIVIMTGATDTDDGLAGYVPSPQRGDNKKALFGDGTFKEVKSSALFVDGDGCISIDYSILKGE